MADRRFFTHRGPVLVSQIATLTHAKLEPASANLEITDLAPLDTASATDLSFLDNTKYLDQFTKSKAGACFVHPKFADRAPKHMVLLVTEQPYLAYAQAAAHFYPTEPVQHAAISASAIIAKTATIGSNVRIDAGAVIEDEVEIGDGCHIGANSVIARAVRIGKHSRIGALCTLSHALIGERVILHRGVHIGQDGFGFAPGPHGILKVPQLGRVVIGNDVEIGSGSCIDRGAGPDTVIGDGCKIDNLVQIGHNARLGKYVVIAAQVGISGSSHIGDGVMLGGQVGIAGHISIGAGSKVAAQSGVMHDMPPGSTYGGSPAMPIKDWHRQTIALSHLTKKRA